MDMNFPPLAFPPWHWSERPARVQASLRSSAFFLAEKKSGLMNARVFLVVAAAVILLFKNAETPGAFLRRKSVGRAFEAAGWEVVSLDIVSKFEPVRHSELGLHYVSGTF